LSYEGIMDIYIYIYIYYKYIGDLLNICVYFSWVEKKNSGRVRERKELTCPPWGQP